MPVTIVDEETISATTQFRPTAPKKSTQSRQQNHIFAGGNSDSLLFNNFFQVNFDELARCTDDFNGAQCKAVCVEAGMIALRRSGSELQHEDYMDGILEVQSKKKTSLMYYA